MKILNQKEELFANEFISQYAKVGFGAMTKNDFEVLIFHLLLFTLEQHCSWVFFVRSIKLSPNSLASLKNYGYIRLIIR